MCIDRFKSDEPAYLQIKHWLLSELSRGRWGRDHPLPPEREIAESFEVSRMTVRHAFSELTHEGWIERIRGKGTFVRDVRIQYGTNGLTSFSQEMKAAGKTPGAAVLRFEIRSGSAEECDRLQVASGTRVVELRRLRTANTLPVGVETAVLPLARVEGITRVPLNQLSSLYQVLRDACGLRLYKANQWMEAGLCGAECAELLGVKTGSAVLQSERTTMDDEGVIVEYVRGVYRGDVYRIHSELLVNPGNVGEKREVGK